MPANQILIAGMARSYIAQFRTNKSFRCCRIQSGSKIHICVEDCGSGNWI